MNEINWEQSIRQFVMQAASAEPTPGGGSVAALVAALGAAMTAMVGNLSQGEKFSAAEPQISTALQVMTKLIKQSEELLAQDIASFNDYMSTLKLKAVSEEQKLAKQQALQAATVQALLVPLQLMLVCKDGLLQAHSIAAIANKNVISDLGISAILLEASAQSALLTIEINIAALKAAALKEQYSLQASSLMTHITELKNTILYTTRLRIAQPSK